MRSNIQTLFLLVLCNEVQMLKTFVGSSLIYGLGHVQDCVFVVSASRFVQSLQEHPLK